MKEKVNRILAFIIIAVFFYEVGCYLSHCHRMRKLEELKARTEILLLDSQYELNDLKLQKEN